MEENKKKLVPKPENIDIPKLIVLKVRRDDQLFQNRSWKFFSYTSNGIKLTDEVKIPNEDIICDNCNAPILSAIVDLIIYENDVGEQFIESAVCKDCLQKSYSKYPVINQIQCIFCQKKIEGFKNKKSEKEFLLSGLCQDCQDSFFKGE